MLRTPDLDAISFEMRSTLKGCERCGGSGFFVDSGIDPLWPQHVRCGCRNEFSFRIRLAEGNVPREFWDVEALEFEWNTSARAAVLDADLQRDRADGMGFFFLGTNGTGKTACASLWLARAARSGFTVGYVTAQDYVSSLIRASDDHDFGEWFRTVESADFFVLDELGKEYRQNTTDNYAQSAIDSLLRLRRGSNLPTTVCTNHDNGKDVKDKYGESIYSILSDRYRTILFDDGDYRRQRLSGKGA